ncbi:hypothetical protein IL306_003257, partial [Fusarium sp. DS 682]
APKSFAEYKIIPEDVRSDTAVFSRDIVNRKLPNKTDDVRSTLSETMTDRCQGQFLWLKIQEDSLRAGMNKKQLQHAIEDTPTGLNDLYDRNWTRITQLKEWEKNRAFALLRWTAFALRPLTVFEITEAVLAVESEDLLLEDLPDAVDDYYVNTEIVGLCGPLIEVRNASSNPCAGQRTVHLPHFSVKQYLLYHLPMPGWILHNDRLQTSHEKIQNIVLAKACLQYVSLRQVWDGALHDSPHPIGVSFRRYGQYQAARVLLSNGHVNPDVRDWMGLTALFAAVANGHLHVAKLLIASGADVEMQAGVGRSLIWWALRAGNTELIQLLVEHAETVGTRIPADHIPNNLVSPPFDDEVPWCDA